MKALLLVNPVSGKGRGLKNLPAVRQKISDLGIEFVQILSEKPKQFLNDFPAINEGDYDVIIVLGGDGFMNEIVNGNKNAVILPYLLIPSGSGNDIGKALDISIKRFIDLPILEPHFKQYDVGAIAIRDSQNNLKIERKFLSSCGVGFDALVSKLSSENKVLRGLPLYLYATIKALAKLKPFTGEIAYSGGEKKGSFSLISTGNTATAGGGFRLTPHALVDDGLLDMMAASECTKLKLLQILPEAIKGSHLRRKEVFYVKTQFISMKLDSQVPVHVDGEFISDDATNIEINILPEKISFHIY